MNTSLLLIHSPLVGPSTWSALAPLTRATGFRVVVPDLTGEATASPIRWSWFVDTAVRSCSDVDGPIILVGHSGAGATLPAIADALGDRCTTTVFVDAIVPPTTGAHHVSAQFVEMLDRQTVDGSLNPWLTWWPDETVSELLPTAALRAHLLADMPRLPRSFYDEPVPVPNDWSNRSNAYVQLSPAYGDDHMDAAERGWPTTAIDSTHLGIVTEPARVLMAILDVVGSWARRATPDTSID